MERIIYKELWSKYSVLILGCGFIFEFFMIDTFVSKFRINLIESVQNWEKQGSFLTTN